MMTLEEAINHAREIAEKNRKCHEENTIILSNRWISSMCCAEEHEQLAKWLEELKKLRKKSKWIPCNERLPENNTDVIVCFYSGEVTEMRYWENGIFQGIYEHTTKAIVAWMPLPEPYKEEEDELQS